MAYTKNTWQTGDVVTAAKLNNIENGIESVGSFLVPCTADWDVPTVTLNKTFKEIMDAADSGRMVLLWMDEEAEKHLYQLEGIFFGEEPYGLLFYSISTPSQPFEFDCNDINDYPVWTQGN